MQRNQKGDQGKGINKKKFKMQKTLTTLANFTLALFKKILFKYYQNLV